MEKEKNKIMPEEIIPMQAADQGDIPTNPGKPDTGKPPVHGMRGSFKPKPETTPEPAPTPEPSEASEKKDVVATTPLSEILAGIEVEEPVETKEPAKKKETGAEYIKRMEAALKERDAAIEAERKKTEAILAERAELEARVERLRLEESPRYKREFVEPINKKLALVDKALAGVEGANKIIETALSLEGKARWDYLDENIDSRTAASAVASTLMEIDALEAKRKEAIDNWQLMAEDYSREGNAKAAALVDGLFDKVVTNVSQRISALRKTGDAANDAAVEARIAQARSILAGEATPEDQATAALLAVSVREYIDANRLLSNENASLRERLSKYEGNKPSIGGRAEETTTTTKPQGFRDRTSQWLSAR